MFNEWRLKNAPYLGQVKKSLSCEIGDQEELIIKQLVSTEAHYARVGTLLAEANSYLDQMTHSFITRPEIVSNYKTVREREIATDGALSDVREMRDKIEALLRAIELRVNLGQSILKQQRNERRYSQ